MSKKKKKSDKSKKSDGKSLKNTNSEALDTPAGTWPFEAGIFTRFDNLRKEMDSVFTQFSDRFGVFQVTDDVSAQVPNWDVSETDSQIIISVEMPGIAQNDIDISINENVLSISGEKQETRQSKDENRRVSERSYGRFERAMTLPFSSNSDCITAEYRDGVLNITIEKPAEEKSKVQKVEIKTAA